MLIPERKNIPSKLISIYCGPKYVRVEMGAKILTFLIDDEQKVTEFIAFLCRNNPKMLFTDPLQCNFSWHFLAGRKYSTFLKPYWIHLFTEV